MKAPKLGSASATAMFPLIQTTSTSYRKYVLRMVFCFMVMSSLGCKPPADTNGGFPSDTVRKYLELVQAKDFEAAERLWYGESKLMFNSSDPEEGITDLRDSLEDFSSKFANMDIEKAIIAKAVKGKSGFWIVNIDWTEEGEEKHYSFGLKIIDGEWKMERGYSW